MTTYAYSSIGYAIPYEAPGWAQFKKQVDIPDLVANGGLAATLPSTGFANTDVLQVFEIPVGFHALVAGVRVTTVEGGTCTIDFGVTTATQIHTETADTDGYIDGASLNTAATIISAVGAGIGADNLMGYVYITDGTADILFNNASTETAIFDIWILGFMAF